jgi:hypothetical protein
MGKYLFSDCGGKMQTASCQKLSIVCYNGFGFSFLNPVPLRGKESSSKTHDDIEYVAALRSENDDACRDLPRRRISYTDPGICDPVITPGSNPGKILAGQLLLSAILGGFTSIGYRQQTSSLTTNHDGDNTGHH